VKWVTLLASCSVSLLCQSVSVYSEFARIDASGEVIAPAQPREILSPAIVRNGFTSFQVVVQMRKGTPYLLYIGENPLHATAVALYRRTEDHLESVELPYQGDSTQVFWLDLRTDRDAPVRRIKIEPQLIISTAESDLGWISYPMEVRVVEATVPGGAAAPGYDAPVLAMKNFVCGTQGSATLQGSDAARLHFRNAQQDVAMAARASKDELRHVMGGCDAGVPDDPEWYLRVRDYLFRMR